ncbi:uncharacterized protein LOC134190928 isoform X2 [Corticium candelabrum]|nr:uncharacterized protein LOC134190928 isoform X2 [Corticium candelabrum]
MLSNESDSIMDSCCGTIVVVPSQPGTLQSPLDKILFHSIEPRFESGNLQVLCVRLTQNSIVPVQLRGTATADYFNSEVSNMWPNLVAHFHEPVRMYHLSSSSAIFPEADVPEVPSLPLNYKFYVRRLSVHRFLCGANKSIFIVPMLLLAIQFMVTVYKTYQAEDKWNISNFKFQDSPNLLCSSSAVTAVSFFLTVVQMTLTTGIPLLMIIKVMAMTTGMNSSLVLPFEHCDINAVWSILNKLYQPRELIDVNANNTIRQAERMIDKALFITVCQTVIHSFVLTLVLCLLRILYDLGHDSSTVVVVLGMVMDFLTGFIGLSCIGIGRALFACETKLCMYKDMWADTQDIPSGPFLQQWKIYEDTWYNCKKLAIGLIIILLMCLFVSNLLYYLCQNTSERESFESLPIMILRTSDFFAICPSGWFLANVSLPLDVLLFGLLIWHIQTQPEDYNVAGIYKYQQYHVNLLLWHLVLRVCFLVILDIGVCCYRGKWKQCQSYVSTAFQGIKMIAAIVLLWYI